MGDSEKDEFEQALASGRRPAVFMFQPKRFRPVPAEQLEEWERSIQEYFGLANVEIDRDKLRSPTWSDSGHGRICADDSDEH